MKLKGYTVVLHEDLNSVAAEVAEDLLKAVIAKREVHRSPLGGRNCISIAEIAKLGRVVVKQYMRGGLFQYFIRRHYLKLGTIRSEAEFQLLSKAHAAGISVPEPVGYIWRGEFLYQAWLVTKEIPGSMTVAEISLKDEDRLPDVMEEVIRQVGLLIKNGICHVDLHPGNVLVDPQGRVYIIDFDKAYQFKGSPNVLRDRYLCRWRRAAIKHELPEVLSEIMSHGLRQSFE